MPEPVSRREFIRRFRALGWEGPIPGGRHAAMRQPLTGVKVPLPNPHRGDVDWSLARRILEQAGIEPGDWEQLGR